MLTYRAAIAATLSLAALSLAVVGAITTRLVSQVTEDARLVEHTQEVLGQVQRVFRTAVDAESGTRGFAITGDDTFLVPYRTARTALSREVAALQRLVSDNPEQRARADALAGVLDAQLRLLEEVANRRESGGFDGARQALLSGEGERLMDGARRLAVDINGQERVLLRDRRNEAAARLRATRAVVFAGTVGAVGALLLAGAQIRSELRQRRRAEASVRVAYADVESKVHARTLELESALQQLQVREDELRVVTELSPVFLFRTDAHGGCEFISAGFFAFTGLTPERSRGFGWTEALEPEDRGHLLNAWQSAIAQGVAFDAESRFRSNEGGTRWFRIRVVPRQASDAGAVLSWVGAAVDIHELKDALAARAALLTRAQDVQRELEGANQLKDDFLATVSHELRTPLNAIVGWAHVLTLPDVTESDRMHAVHAIQRNAKAQTRLIEDLLDVSSMIRGRLNITISSVDLRAVAEQAAETIAPAARARDVRLTLDLADAPLVIAGDESRLQQVVWNLLSNAVKFSPKGGEVRIRADRMGSRGRVRVDDGGEGIDPAFLPHVFEPFRQGPSAAMRSGLGLGLAIVRRLVELHGGTITAESSGRGTGASFAVTFPLHQGVALARVPSGVARPSGLSGVKVLLAEDDDDSAAALSAVLKLRGCQVRTARTAGQCLHVLAGWHPDIFLCDVGLPDDDGYSLLRRARAVPGAEGLPAIALTAFAGGEDRVRALAAGFNAYVAKPFDPDVVVGEMASALGPRGLAP